MKELIGQVTLDYEYYSGSDLYCDGDVEDEMLNIAKDHTEAELNQVIAERKEWPILYHFSDLRKNIVEWIPIGEAQTVLEVGAGCGAITGAFAKKAQSVTSIELSKKRSLINAYRNREYDNVEVKVGNYKDIEKTVGIFDYVSLIGVLEYAELYMDGDNAYTTMLKNVKGHLKPGGKLILAIENRLGLKYFAGCKEDHLSEYFKGIEGYPVSKGIKTFSKKELENVLRESGFQKQTFYYPYPDYKFPTTIYSDKFLPKENDLNNNIRNFDMERMLLFDETKVFDSLIENELFPEFSNSFLVIAE